ncbi:VrrA/YqfQ family protein [Geobacillus subterraneus]|uniref:VrrA/YqfQ family protein n=1 Tax=Geobacillus subterraneus TaxID=129338 RepID=UPI002AC8973A|nr:VrrA/YqfQ family protein [Geobacillus subterraneus]WPZ17418.1 VrrA/YqfQ family protein [Geobacillus subterraneus]
MRYSRPPMMPSPFAGMPPAPFTRMPAVAPRPGGAGGLLARLFSRGQPPAAAPTSWGLPLLQNAAANTATTANTSGGFIGMLNNVQKMLGIAQNVMPMVQQYGPLIRNLPAMIRIFRELKPADEEEGETKPTESAPAKETKQKPAAQAAKKRSVPQAKRETPQEKQTPVAPRPSTPKLYI